MVLSEHILQLAAASIVVLSLLDLARFLRLELLHTLARLWQPRWKQVEKLFRVDELTLLVDNGNHRLEVSVVERVQDGAHDAQTLALLNELRVVSDSLVDSLLLSVFKFEVAHLDKLAVVGLALTDDVSLGVLLHLVLQFVENRRNKVAVLTTLG